MLPLNTVYFTSKYLRQNNRENINRREKHTEKSIVEKQKRERKKEHFHIKKNLLISLFTIKKNCPKEKKTKPHRVESNKSIVIFITSTPIATRIDTMHMATHRHWSMTAPRYDGHGHRSSLVHSVCAIRGSLALVGFVSHRICRQTVSI